MTWIAPPGSGFDGRDRRACGRADEQQQQGELLHGETPAGKVWIVAEAAFPRTLCHVLPGSRDLLPNVRAD